MITMDTMYSEVSIICSVSKSKYLIHALSSTISVWTMLSQACEMKYKSRLTLVTCKARMTQIMKTVVLFAGNSVVCAKACLVLRQREHQSPALWDIYEGNLRVTGRSLPRGLVMRHRVSFHVCIIWAKSWNCGCLVTWSFVTWPICFSGIFHSRQLWPG